MKKYIITILIILLTFGYLHAQSSPTVTDTAALRKSLDTALTAIEKINSLVDSLSIKVSLPNSSVILKDKDKWDKWPVTTALTKRINDECLKFQTIHLREKLQPSKCPEFDIQDLHFSVQHDLMNDAIVPFLGYGDKELYDAQIDYAEARIERFLTVIGNFKIYLLSLTPKPTQSTPKAPDWETIINNALKNYKPIFKDTCNCKGIVEVTKTIDLINKTTGLILGKTPVADNAIYKHYAIISGYSESTFGFGFFQAVGKPGAAKEMNYIGAELILPIRSTLYANAGGFLLYGLRKDKILLQAGIGYLAINQVKENISLTSTTLNDNQIPQTQTATGVETDSQKKQNISWKAAIIYTPNKFGIGFSYSPLTRAGIQIGYRL